MNHNIMERPKMNKVVGKKNKISPKMAGTESKMTSHGHPRPILTWQQDISKAKQRVRSFAYGENSLYDFGYPNDHW